MRVYQNPPGELRKSGNIWTIMDWSTIETYNLYWLDRFPVITPKPILAFSVSHRPINGAWFRHFCHRVAQSKSFTLLFSIPFKDTLTYLSRDNGCVCCYKIPFWQGIGAVITRCRSYDKPHCRHSLFSQTLTAETYPFDHSSVLRYVVSYVSRRPDHKWMTFQAVYFSSWELCSTWVYLRWIAASFANTFILVNSTISLGQRQKKLLQWSILLNNTLAQRYLDFCRSAPSTLSLMPSILVNFPKLLAQWYEKHVPIRLPVLEQHVFRNGTSNNVYLFCRTYFKITILDKNAVLIFISNS